MTQMGDARRGDGASFVQKVSISTQMASYFLKKDFEQMIWEVDENLDGQL